MLALFILLGFIVLTLIWVHQSLNKKIPLGITVLIYPLIGLIIGIYAMFTKKSFEETITWIPSLDINFTWKLDGLSLIFFLLISFMGILVVFYSIFYLTKHENLLKFYSYLLLFMIAMYGVILSTNTIILYIFWEMTSISSFLLISFWYTKKNAYQGALKSFLITVFGGMMMLLGVLALYEITGTNDITKMAELLNQNDKNSLYYFAMITIVLGALTKSAQFPFHIWLPDAMEAPTPVSAYLHSATMVKAGIYLLLRFMPVFSGEPIFQWILIIDGLLTMLIGSIFAVRQSDLKGLLAYSTISQLGMIVSLIGLSAFDSAIFTLKPLIVLATTTALLHIINHGIFKAALFMGTGIVDHAVHTRDLNKLGGLRKVLPITFTVMTVAALSMAGLPFLNGFLSKEMFLTALVDLKETDISVVWLLVLIGVIASIGTFVYSLLAISRTFFGEQKLQVEHGETIGIIVAPIILGICTILFFFIPNFLLYNLIEPALQIILNFDTTNYLKPISAWHGFNVPLVLTALIITIGSLIVWTGSYRRIFPKFNQMPLNIIYQQSLKYVDIVSHYLIRRIMTDRLNHYLMFLFSAILVATLPLTLAVVNEVYTAFKVTEVSYYAFILVGFIAVACVVLMKIQSRMTAIVLTGTIGYGVSMIYVLMYAPDLALTQLVIEIITTILFLSSFYHLPKLEKENKSNLNKNVSFLIAFSMALLIVTMMIISQSTELYDSISEYYHDAYNLTGGKNIVNAILGDFRALDTLLEGVVLMITGLGIYSLITKKGEVRDERK